MFLMCSTHRMPTQQAPLHHDDRLRAATRAIYEACYPDEDTAVFPFAEAEQRGSFQYHQALEAARQARAVFAAPEQPSLL